MHGGLLLLLLVASAVLLVLLGWVDVHRHITEPLPWCRAAWVAAAGLRFGLHWPMVGSMRC